MIFQETIANLLGTSFLLILITISLYNSVTLIQDYKMTPDIHMKAFLWVQGILAAALSFIWIYLLITLMKG